MSLVNPFYAKTKRTLANRVVGVLMYEPKSVGIERIERTCHSSKRGVCYGLFPTIRWRAKPLYTYPWTLRLSK